MYFSAFVTGGIVAAGPQLFAEKKIPGAALRQDLLQDIKVELGINRLKGLDRTSHSAVMPCRRNRSMKSSCGCVEWPMVNTVPCMVIAVVC